MKLSDKFKKISKKTKSDKMEVPSGLIKRCNHCKSVVFVEEVNNNYNICPH